MAHHRREAGVHHSLVLPVVRRSSEELSDSSCNACLAPLHSPQGSVDSIESHSDGASEGSIDSNWEPLCNPHRSSSANCRATRQMHPLVRACQPQHCLVEGCMHKPCCNFNGLKLRLYCQKHKEEGMIFVE